MGARAVSHDEPEQLTELSPFQNERLRDALHDYRREHHWTKARLAEAIGMKPSSLSRIINRHGGMALENAESFAKLVGKPLSELMGPPGPLPGEDFPWLTQWLSTQGGAHRPHEAVRITERATQATTGGADRMMTVTFAMNLRRMPGLEDWIMAHPTVCLPVSRMVQAMEAYSGLPLTERGDGSILWWSQFLQPFVAVAAPTDDARTVSGKRRKVSP